MEPKKVYIPRGSVALSLGADALASEIVKSAQARKLPLGIVRTGSRGLHWLEPLIEVETPEGRVGFGPVQASDIPTLVEAISSDALEHPKAIGLIEAIPFLQDQTRLIFGRCGITDPVSCAAYKDEGGYAGLSKALQMKPELVCGEILESGLRGRGGAAFPAGIKWNTVHKAPGEQKYIVVNADEGDSGTFADRMIMESDPFLLIEGMTIAGIAVGATRGFIYLRSEYPVAEAILKEAIEDAYAHQMLGKGIAGSEHTFDLTVFTGAGAYICGEETSLLNSLEGKRGEVRVKPPLPALEGLHGKPTLVHNVISLCSVPAILAEGAAFYKDFGLGRSTGTMPFQLAGNIKHGGLFEAPFGISIEDLVFKYGGGSRSGRETRAVQIGGPLGAYLPKELFHLPMDYETIAKEKAGIGHGGIVVYDDSVDLAEQARYAFEFCVEESCGKCTPCRIGSVRGVELMDRIIEGDQSEDQFELLDDLCELMEDGSLCAMGGMTPIPVLSALKHFPEDFHRSPAQSKRDEA